MPNVPRTKDEILQGLAARTVALSRLTDVEPGGVAMSILGANAEEFELVGGELKAFRDAFSFINAIGSELDERLRDLPPGFQARLGPSAASGNAVRLRRSTTTGTLDVPAGASIAREDNPDLAYAITTAVQFADGEEYYPAAGSSDPYAHVVCTTRGSVGNAPSGTLNVPISLPNDIIAVDNPNPVGGGEDREKDSRLIQRALAYLSGLARVQTAAQLYLALTYESSDGVRLRHVSAFEDPERPAYTELVIDDGSGMAGYTQAGPTVDGTIPPSGIAILHFDSPMVGPGFLLERDQGSGFAPYTWSPGTAPPWSIVEERGVLYPQVGVFSAGDGWRISGYDVYTRIIRELQTLIESDPTDLFRVPGYRPSGGRVRVVAPTIQWVGVQLALVAEAGVNDLAALKQRVKDQVIAFLQALGPGEPLLLKRLTRAIMAVRGVLNFEYVTPTGDVYPGDLRTVLRSSADLVGVQ